MNLTANQVLKIIKNCIKVFWLFVKADSKKAAWKVRNILWTNQPVEDPRDLELLHDLRKTLKKVNIPNQIIITIAVYPNIFLLCSTDLLVNDLLD